MFPLVANVVSATGAPRQIAVSAMVATVGCGKTFITIESVLLHPLLPVTCKKYLVVVSGEATGLMADASLNPATGDQL